MPTTYCDIDPIPDREGVLGRRNRMTTESGCLSVSGTPLEAISDGTGNTIMIAESAGRLPESAPPFMCGEFADPMCEDSEVQNDACTKTGRRAFWRWAEPTCAGGISGQRNYMAGRKKVDFVNGNKVPKFGGASNEISTTSCLAPPAEGTNTTCLWSWTNCGPNDEIFSWHQPGANVLMADGAVRLIQSNVRPDILRYLLTRAEGSPLTVTGTF
jgi:prepilin-type processing-associated H-X9-DG protein